MPTPLFLKQAYGQIYNDDVTINYLLVYIIFCVLHISDLQILLFIFVTKRSHKVVAKTDTIYLLTQQITINVPLFKKLRDIIFFLRVNNFLSHFEGHFEGAKTFFDPLNCPERSEGQFRGQKSRGPLKMSQEMAKKFIVPKKKNYVPKFLKQRDIGNFMSFFNHGPSILSLYSFFSSY